MIIDNTIVVWRAIPTGEAGSRRQRERDTVLALLRDTLGSDCSLTHDTDGAPQLEGWHISISHSIDLAVVALNRDQRIGVDAETMRDALWRVRPKFLSSTEMEFCDTPRRLLRAWTAKEAAYKAAGIRTLSFVDGIRLSPSLFLASTPNLDFRLTYIFTDQNTIALATRREESC